MHCLSGVIHFFFFFKYTDAHVYRHSVHTQYIKGRWTYLHCTWVKRVLHRNVTVHNYLKHIFCSVIKCSAQCDDSFGVKTVCMSLFVHALIFLQCLPESRGQAGDGQDEIVVQAAGCLP